jgi:hypothetical protein
MIPPGKTAKLPIKKLYNFLTPYLPYLAVIERCQDMLLESSGFHVIFLSTLRHSKFPLRESILNIGDIIYCAQ